MYFIRIIFFLLFSSIIISCKNNKNVSNIIVKGVVLDSLSGKPIPGARITVLCWRAVGYDEETYDKVDTITDANGKFQVVFAEGFKLDVGSIAPHYHPGMQEISDLNQASNIILRLKENSAVGELKNFGRIAVFMRTYKTTVAKPTEYYGIDILNGKNTRSRDSADISIPPEFNTAHPQFSITSNDGGLVPIFDTTESYIAPENGYIKTYELKGKEKGFFIRCRDGETYGRLSIIADYSRSSPYSDGHFEDVGVMFKVELQTSGKEFGISEGFRLDQYILKGI